MNTQLNEYGIKLARLTGKSLRSVRFDAAFSSPLQRAIQTSHIILNESGNHCPILLDPRIAEIDLGDWQGKKIRPEECEIDEEQCRRFFSDPDIDFIYPNGESIHMVMERTQSFLKWLSTQQYHTVLVSSHGCAIRCMLNFLYSNPKDFWHGNKLLNCAVNIIEILNHKIRILEEDKIYYDPCYIIDRYADIVPITGTESHTGL